jgi:hypothetical protein
METNLYHSFNARNLSPDEIANSFIANSQYKELTQINHSLLLGPRGCGKTTLLKMLMPQTINIWNSITDNEYIDLPFYGVYIPTDNQWKRQLVQLNNSFPLFPDFAKIISKVVVNTNVIKSIVNTFFQLLEIADREDEDFFKSKRSLCIDLINIFHLEKPISPDLVAIEFSIRQRLSHINQIVNKAKFTKTVKHDELPDYFFSDFFELASTSLFAFKKHFEGDKSFEGSHFRWALCFDELELAPEWLQENLINQLRSRSDQNILYKLTSTPIVKIEVSISDRDVILDSSDLNDYNVIRAWTYDRSGFLRWNNFANKLAEKKIKNYFGQQISPTAIFGEYDIEKVLRNMKLSNQKDILPDLQDSWDSNFKKGTIMWHLLKYLSINDKSFRQYLDLKGISYLNPIPQNEKQMGPIFRKIKPLVIYRSQLVRNNNVIRRKSIPFYFGINNIYEICDGNPRFLTALIDELLSSNFTNDSIQEITPEKQSAIVYKIAERHLQIIAAHPDSSIEIHGKVENLGKLINQIGAYFSNYLFLKDFTTEPVGSFLVDDQVNEKIINLINLGVRLGAFVYIDPKQALSENGILQKRFRLSYLLHPNFKLPIREYGYRNLSTILKEGKKNDITLNLFSEEL